MKNDNKFNNSWLNYIKFEYTLNYRTCRYKNLNIQKFLSEALKTFYRLPVNLIVKVDCNYEDGNIQLYKKNDVNDKTKIIFYNTPWNTIILNDDEIINKKASALSEGTLIKQYKIKES